MKLSLKSLQIPGFSSQAVAPAVVLAVLAMMLIPLPPAALDALFTFNIAASIMVLLAAMQIKSFKDFIAFPTILLITTLLRLSLNVASTRVVLAEGHTGPDAAGVVIEAFGLFLIGGNFAIGIIVFLVITLINFMVITKGAGRVAEVSARFALDPCPANRWPLMRTSMPASSKKMRPASAAKKSAKRPIFMAPWMVPRSLSEAMPSPAS